MSSGNLSAIICASLRLSHWLLKLAAAVLRAAAVVQGRGERPFHWLLAPHMKTAASG